MRDRAIGHSRAWTIIGWLSVFIPLIGLSYYSVVAGWALEYFVRPTGEGDRIVDATASGAVFNSLLASPQRMLLLHTLFMGSTAFVVYRGVYRGIELFSKIIMPALLVLLMVLVLYSVFAADIRAGLSFLFAPDFSKLSLKVVLMALGQAFFSVAIGVGVIMTYGSYMPKEYSLPSSAATIALVDTGVAILAGIAIFPIVFAYGLDPAGGPGLIFVTLPIAFGQMPAGEVLGVLFFAMLFFAAFSTAIGMLEPAVSWFVDNGHGRGKTAVMFAGACWLLGIAAIFSFNIWSDVRPVPWLDLLANKDIFNFMDFVVSNALLPINGLLIALFAGWILSRADMASELRLASAKTFGIWIFAVRWLAPIAIGLIVITSLTQ